MATFWDKMELWEKMLFVLACAMVITIVFAIIKLLYGRSSIKKHTKINDAQKAHLENVRNSRNLIQLKGEDVPFGIKALESGIEVEGIVISRPASQASIVGVNPSQLTLVGSDNGSVKGKGVATPTSPGPMQQVGTGSWPLVYQPSPYLSIPPAAYQSPSQSSAASSASSRRSSPPTLSRAPSTDGRPPLDGPSGESITPPNHPGNLTPQQPKPVMLTNYDTLARLEGRVPSAARLAELRRNPGGPEGRRTSGGTPSRTPSPPDESLPSVDEDSTGESARESDSSIEEQHPRPRLMSAYSTPVVYTVGHSRGHLSGSPQGDLSLLHTHRLSHAAEVGQLLPRRSRASRLQLNLSNSPEPGSPSASPEFYNTPAHLDPVYALDIALPPPQLVGPIDTGRASFITATSDRPVSAGSSGSKGRKSSFSESLHEPTLPGADEENQRGRVLSQQLDGPSDPKRPRSSSRKKLQKKRRTNSG